MRKKVIGANLPVRNGLEKTGIAPEVINFTELFYDIIYFCFHCFVCFLEGSVDCAHGEVKKKNLILFLTVPSYMH